MRNKIVVLISSLLIGASIMAVNYAMKTKSETPTQRSTIMTVISPSSLATHDGKDGRACYVAVDGTVYEIKDSAYWQNGSHSPSNGQAYCGADMSNAINQSPHGRGVLERFTVIGTLGAK